MKKYVIPAMLIASITFATACGNDQDGTTNGDSLEVGTTETAMGADANNANDRDFVLEAANGGMMEVELGKLAQTNASSAAVKEFGQMMVTDHSKANEELKGIAASKNIELPAAPTGEKMDHINELKTKTGAEFDKAYMDMMVEDHQEDIDAFQKEADSGMDADVKAFAAKTLPVLKMHQDKAKETHEKVK